MTDPRLPLTAELLLLLHDDETGKPLVSAQKRRAVTAGAAMSPRRSPS